MFVLLHAVKNKNNLKPMESMGQCVTARKVGQNQVKKTVDNPSDDLTSRFAYLLSCQDTNSYTRGNQHDFLPTGHYGPGLLDEQLVLRKESSAAVTW